MYVPLYLSWNKPHVTLHHAFRLYRATDIAKIILCLLQARPTSRENKLVMTNTSQIVYLSTMCDKFD